MRLAWRQTRWGATGVWFHCVRKVKRALGLSSGLAKSIGRRERAARGSEERQAKRRGPELRHARLLGPSVINSNGPAHCENRQHVWWPAHASTGARPLLLPLELDDKEEQRVQLVARPNLRARLASNRWSRRALVGHVRGGGQGKTAAAIHHLAGGRPAAWMDGWRTAGACSGAAPELSQCLCLCVIIKLALLLQPLLLLPAHLGADASWPC